MMLSKLAERYAMGKPRADAPQLKQIDRPIENIIHKDTW